MRDALYRSENPAHLPFEFTEEVAEVFPDMIARSVPGYAATLRLIGSIADRYVTPGSRVYDLGSSLGAATFSIQHQIGNRAELVAVDNSEAMMAGLRKKLSEEGTDGVRPVLEDVRNVEIRNASLTVLNFTLQFVPMADREPLLAGIFEGTLPGGVLVLSEKIAFEDPQTQEEMRCLHEAFKKENGYSELEISRKRTALENVLIPETLLIHQERLKRTGFSVCQVWLQCFNFVSLLAFKK